MINRELIRLKVVQTVYAYYQNEGQDVTTMERTLFHSLGRAYDLYRQLLLLLTDIAYTADRAVETQEAKAMRLGDHTKLASKKFTANRFMAQLRRNEQLRRYADTAGSIWQEEQEFVRRLYVMATQKDFFTDYLVSQDDSYEADRELVRKLYRFVVVENEDIDDFLEDQDIFWNDDKAIVDTFVLKTIKRFEEKNGGLQTLMPDFKNEADRDFASQLLRNTLTNAEYYRQLIDMQMLHWDLERMPLMDLIIMQVAIAEILSFPSIPVSVSLNEYVEIAKAYSTPRSGSYVNATLDGIAVRLDSEGKLGDKTLDNKTTNNDTQQ